jgi:uncharacterized membrane protein
MTTFRSDLTGQEHPISERMPGKAVRKSLMDLIQQDQPGFGPNQFLSASELDVYREKYISACMVKQIGELTDLEKTVLNSINGQTILADKLDGEDNSPLTFGQKVADKVATFGGSWTFILSFFAFLAGWILFNVFWLANRAFDPYPFILLNLILSCIAALQAPVIMMSQNRQEEKDRERAKKDYMINLKSELEIRTLHEKIDHLILYQQQELLEIQKIQVEMMTNILQRLEAKRQD